MKTPSIPPHLKIAEGVSDEEYVRAKWQSKLLISIALVSGTVSGVILIFFGTGMIPGIVAAGAVAIVVERALHTVFKDAHKAKTHKHKIYKELKAYRERLGLPSDEG